MNTTEFTPAQKAARTRFDNKAYAKLDKATLQIDEALDDLVDSLIPERNQIIDKAEADRDALIAEITQNYQVIIDAEMAKFNKTIEPLQEKRNAMFSEAFAIYKQEMADFDAKQSQEAK